MKYRTAGSWGAGEGRDLTPAEVDANIYEADTRIDALEADSALDATITLNQSGSTVTFYADGVSIGSVTLPTSQWRDRGTWAASTAYAVNDIVSVEGSGVYRVIAAHTSESTFDADASASDGDYYSRLISMPNPAEVIAVTDDSLVLTIAHANKYIRCNNASGTTVYLEAGVFPPNTEIHFRQAGTGPIIIAIGDSGTALNVEAGYDAASDTRGATFTIKHYINDEWDVFGRLSEVTA